MKFKILSIKSWLQRQKHGHCMRALSQVWLLMQKMKWNSSIQTPALQTSSYDLAITMPGIFLLTCVYFCSSCFLSAKSIINKIFLRI